MIYSMHYNQKRVTIEFNSVPLSSKIIMKFNKNIFILVTSQYSTSSINNIVKHIIIIKFVLPIIVKFSDVNGYGNMVTTEVFIIIISSISIMIIILKVLTSVINCRIIKKYQLLLNKYHNIKTMFLTIYHWN